jgi:hypothetical protein
VLRTGVTGYELGDGARGGTFVLANVRNNEIFCLGVSVSVDGDEGGDGYSPLGDFELELGGGDDKNGDNDGNARGGNRHNCRGQQTDKTGDSRRDPGIRDNEYLADGNRGRRSTSSREPTGFWDHGDLHLADGGLEESAGPGDVDQNHKDSGPMGILLLQRTGKTMQTGQAFQVRKTRLTELA